MLEILTIANSDTLPAGFELTQNPSRGFAKRSCIVVTTNTPRSNMIYDLLQDLIKKATLLKLSIKTFNRRAIEIFIVKIGIDNPILYDIFPLKSIN